MFTFMLGTENRWQKVSRR